MNEDMRHENVCPQCHLHRRDCSCDLTRGMPPAAMSDLEITKACALAMGYRISDETEFEKSGLWCHLPAQHGEWYRPLCCDTYGNAQAMALLKTFSIQVHHHGFAGATASLVTVQGRMKLDDVPTKVCARELNRAICECVAKMVKP